MDHIQAMRQRFTQRFGRAPSEMELGDMMLAGAIAWYADLGAAPDAVTAKFQQMMTPGTPWNAFLRHFK